MNELTESTIMWPTKREVAARLNVTTKTIEKYVQDGKLEQQMQSQINRPARAVINPKSLEKFIEERQKQLLPLARTPKEEGSQARGVKMQNWPPPLYLTTQEAMYFSGLSEGYLGRLVREGKLRRLEDGIRGYRYRRVDLENL